jgi:hypothetical protein
MADVWQEKADVVIVGYGGQARQLPFQLMMPARL